MFELFSRRGRIYGGSGPDAGRIKRGRVVGFGYGGAAIWGAIGWPEIGRPGVSADSRMHAGSRGRWGRCWENEETWG
jgi:hypothetical protein